MCCRCHYIIEQQHNTVTDTMQNTVCMPNVVVSSFAALASHLKSAVKNLGVTFDSCVQFDKQIDAVVKTSFYQLRLLAEVKPFLNHHDLEDAFHAFITSRLFHCSCIHSEHK